MRLAPRASGKRDGPERNSYCDDVFTYRSRQRADLCDGRHACAISAIRAGECAGYSENDAGYARRDESHERAAQHARNDRKYRCAWWNAGQCVNDVLAYGKYGKSDSGDAAAQSEKDRFTRKRSKSGNETEHERGNKSH